MTYGSKVNHFYIVCMELSRDSWCLRISLINILIKCSYHERNVLMDLTKLPMYGSKHECRWMQHILLMYGTLTLLKSKIYIVDLTKLAMYGNKHECRWMQHILLMYGTLTLLKSRIYIVNLTSVEWSISWQIECDLCCI